LDTEDKEGMLVEGRWRIIGAGKYFKELSRVGAISIGLRNYLKDYFMAYYRSWTIFQRIVKSRS